MDIDSLDAQIVMTIDRLTLSLRDEAVSPNCPSFQRIVDEFATLEERKRVTARMLELKDMNVISFYRTDPIIVSLTGEVHENLDAPANQAIAEWRRRFYPLKSDAAKGSA